MGRRKGGRFHASKGVKNNVWAVAAAFDTTLSAGTTTFIPCVIADDWSTGSERATLLTMRGWFSVCGQNQIAAAQLEGSVAWYIALMDEDITAFPSPFLPSTYVDEIIMTTGGHTFEHVAIGGRRNTKDWDINLKTMRTLHSGTDVILVLRNETADDVTFSGVFRSLLRRGGN